MTPYVLRNSQGNKLEEFNELDKAIYRFKELKDNVVLAKQNSGECIYNSEDKTGYCVCIHGKVLNIVPTIEEAIAKII